MSDLNRLSLFSMNPQSEKLKMMLRSVQQQKMTSEVCPELSVIRTKLGIGSEMKRMTSQPQEIIMDSPVPEIEKNEREISEQMEILRQINEARQQRGQIVGDPSTGPKRGVGPTPHQNIQGANPYRRQGFPGMIPAQMPVMQRGFQPLGVNPPDGADDAQEREGYVDQDNQY